MIILATSAVVEMLLNLPLGPAVRERIAARDATLHAPQLLVVEVLQVLRRRAGAGRSRRRRRLRLLWSCSISWTWTSTTIVC